MTHEAIATVATPDIDAAVAAVARHAVAEVRLDRLWPAPPEPDAAADALERLVEAGGRLIATLRPRRQGGGYDGPEDVRISLLVAAARAGFEVIDIETDLQDVGRLIHSLRAEAEVIASDHTVHSMPSREAGLLRLRAMQDLRPTREKLALPCGSFVEILRALELTYNHAEREGHPAIAPLGGGAPLRALLALLGNESTYGYATGLAPAVSGQPALAEIEAVWQHWGIDDMGHGGWLGILGDPVAHSLSPRIHNAMLRADGRPQRYGALQVPDSGGAVRLLCTAAPRIGLLGASVTAPLKAHAAAAVPGDDWVAGTGAANCLRFVGEPASTNTDASAFQRLFADDGANSLAILGAGGAARAAAWAGAQAGMEVQVFARRPERWLAMDGVQVKPWAERNNVAADAWVQATPTGPEGNLIDADRLGGATTAIELVYAGGQTSFERDAAAAGARVTSGRAFLIEQALDAYRFWFGVDADRAVMEAAL